MRDLNRWASWLATIAGVTASAVLLTCVAHGQGWSFLPEALRGWLALVPARVAAGWPLVVVWSVARLFALLPAWSWLARPLALRMALVEAGIGILLAPTLLGAKAAGLVALFAIAAVVVIGGGFALFGNDEPGPGAVLAGADSVAPHSAGLWSLQGLLAIVAGAGLVAQGVRAGITVARAPNEGPWIASWGLLLVGLGLLSWLGAGPQRIIPGPDPEASFKRFGRLFTLAFALIGLAPFGGVSVAALLEEGHSVQTGSSLVTGLVAFPLALANEALLLHRDWMAERIDWVRSRMSGLWIVQFLLYLVPGLIWLLGWAKVSANLRDGDPLAPTGGLPSGFGPDAVFLIGALAMTMSAATLFAIGRVGTWERRLFARGFTVWCVWWLTVVIYNMSGHFGADPVRYTLAGVGATIPVILVTPPNVLASISQTVGPQTVLQTGDADTRPFLLLPIWFVQGLILGAVAIALTFAPGHVAAWVSAPMRRAPDTWELDQMRIHGPYFGFAAFLSWAAMTRLDRWFWRAIARQFVFFGVALLFAYVLVYNTIVYSRAALLGPAVALVILVVNLLLLFHPSVPEDLGITPGPLGLGDGDMVAAAPMAVQTAQTQKRASHLYGVGAEGSLRVSIPDPSDAHFPQNELFHKERTATLPVTMRFANLTYEDDAGLDVRGAALRIGEEDSPDRFDLVFNTGSFSPPRNLYEFATFVLSKWAPSFVEKRAVKSNLLFFEGGVAGLRRAPESYTKLFYYSQIVRIWVGVRGPTRVLEPPQGGRTFDGLRRMFLVRYRLAPIALLPADRPPERAPETYPLSAYAPESGLPDDTDTASMWLRGRRPDERRAIDYLRSGLKQALLKGEPVRFALQAQFHEVEEPTGEGETLAWYNAGVDWDDDSGCRFRDLGEIRLTRGLADEVTERLWFNPGCHPLSMGVPASPGPSDYRSLGDAEVRVMRALYAVRKRFERWGGVA